MTTPRRGERNGPRDVVGGWCCGGTRGPHGAPGLGAAPVASAPGHLRAEQRGAGCWDRLSGSAGATERLPPEESGGAVTSGRTWEGNTRRKGGSRRKGGPRHRHRSLKVSDGEGSEALPRVEVEAGDKPGRRSREARQKTAC